jgi:hypothetical protein
MVIKRLFFATAIMATSWAGVACADDAQTAYLRSLRALPFGTTPADWIAKFGKPVSTNPENPASLDQGEVWVFFDTGDVVIGPCFFNGLADRVEFVARDTNNKTGLKITE